MYDKYQSPLSERYASKEMQYIFSPDKKFKTWRKDVYKRQGLDILDAGINFDKNNVTRFVILSKKRQYTQNANKISISFSLLHESGTLYNILSHFLYNDLNLSHIESVPLPDQQWEYRFYIDISGNLHDPAVKNALQGVRTEVADFKILGNY